MRKVYNFNAGPAMLPEEVLLKAQAEMLDWQGSGMSVMEIGHRGSLFQDLAAQTETDLRELMSIPPNYHVLFLSGGATAQFAMVPINLFTRKRKADYVDTGIWSKKAIAEAKRYGEVNVVAHTMYDNKLAFIPTQDEWLPLSTDAAYVHYTPNETIDTLEFNWVPQTGNVPLVSDMTSVILSRPMDVTDYGVIYASAQKNLGQAGITIVIVRDDLIDEPLPHMPTLYSYKLHAENRSFYNTPPTYSWYISSLVFSWLKQQGGVEGIYKCNLRKAKRLYDIVEAYPDFYMNRIRPDCRSLMNVAFYLPNELLTTLFLQESEACGLVNLRGHRVSGGVRASIYNAMPEAAVNLLADFMIDFAKKYA